jgi:serine O-acetyltransferase
MTEQPWPRQRLVGLQNAAHRLDKFSWTRPLARLVEIAIRLCFSATIPAAARIDRSVHFGHAALGVVLNKLCVIEANCLIGTHVVMGGKSPLIGAPYVEADTTIHAGAKLIGPIRIGRGSVIGANAVVNRDIPPYSVAVGVPARVIKTLPQKAENAGANYHRDEALPMSPAVGNFTPRTGSSSR